MFRRFAGSSFAAALLAIMVMKHVVLGFCLCQEQFVTHDDKATCCTIIVTTLSCGGDEDESPAADPCKDCVVDIQLEVNDFLWDGDEFSPANEMGAPLAVPVSPFHSMEASGLVRTLRPPMRGPPPGTPPLDLRTRVLRL